MRDLGLSERLVYLIFLKLVLLVVICFCTMSIDPFLSFFLSLIIVIYNQVFWFRLADQAILGVTNSLSILPVGALQSEYLGITALHSKSFKGYSGYFSDFRLLNLIDMTYETNQF